MTALALLLVMLAPHHVDDDTRDLMTAIDHLCETPRCVADAVTTCYIETRCRMGICCSHGCGPYQQLPRYASVDGATRETLPVDPVVATRQFLAKRERYRRSHGSAWPRRYNGSDRAEAYFQKWMKINRRLRREQDKIAASK